MAYDLGRFDQVTSSPMSPPRPAEDSAIMFSAPILREAGVVMLGCVAAAITLFALGSGDLFAWGWPLLIAVAGLAWAGSLLATRDAGAWFHSRQLRLRVPLEFALFHALRSQRLGMVEDSILHHLRKARHAAGETPPGPQLDSIIDRMASGDQAGGPSAIAEVARELADMLRDIARARDSRSPLRSYRVLRNESNAPLGFVVAVAGVVVAPAAPGITLLSLDGALQALVLFALAYEGLRLLRVMTYKVHDIRANRAFRTIIVCTVGDRTAASDLAELLYPKISHVVHVLVGPLKKRQPPPELDNAGKYWFLTEADGVADVLASVAANADLVVLDGGDAATAQIVRATTGLPDQRYLALSTSGTVPQGYRWIEPMALSAGPHTDPDLDPHRLSVRQAGPAWGNWAFLLLVAGSVPYFQLDGGRWLAILLLLAAACRRLPDEVGPARRSLISRTTLRAPRAPHLSQRLAPRVLARYLWIGASMAALPALWFVHPSFEFGVDIASDIRVAVMAAAALLACAFVVPGLLVAVKWSIDRNFRILVLRRNSSKYGYGHKIVVMLTCGKYGQVVSLRDPTFDQTDDGTGEWRESSFGAWFEIFTEINTMVQPVGILDNWQRRILMELEVADFAVFDWIDEITEAMQWELRRAAERLPAHRMLIVCGRGREEIVADTIASCLDVLDGTPHCLFAARGSDNEYVWSNHSAFEAAFASELHAALVALGPEPRQTLRRETLGAWPWPVRGE